LEKVLIGEDVSRRLDVTPAKFSVIVTRRREWRNAVAQPTRIPTLMRSRAQGKQDHCLMRRSGGDDL
jgi:transposase